MGKKIEKPQDLYHPVSDHPLETIDNLDKITIEENGEPLVALALVCPNVLVQPRFGRKKRTLLARKSVAQRLNVAQCWLSTHYPGYRIIVVDAHRDFADQQRFHMFARRIMRLRHPTWSDELIREATNQYVATTDAITPPPHTTGGAIDVRMMGPDGAEIKMQGPLLKLESAYMDYADLPEERKQARKILSEALSGAGFSNYEEEWWHWSYGDSGWALRTQVQTDDPFRPLTAADVQGICAIYGRIERPAEGQDLSASQEPSHE